MLSMMSTYKKYSSADNNLEVLYSKKKNGLLTLSKTVSITILFNSYIRIFLQCPVKSSFLFFTHLSQLCCLVSCYAGINDFLNITIHNLIKLIKCKTNSVVCNSSLWEVVSSYLLSSVTSTYLAPSCISFCIVCFLSFKVI